jgi:hypothetical protein
MSRGRRLFPQEQPPLMSVVAEALGCVSAPMWERGLGILVTHLCITKGLGEVLMSQISMEASLILQSQNCGITQKEELLLFDFLKKLRVPIKHLEQLHQRQWRARLARLVT